MGHSLTPPVSAISWLENDVFLLAHTPSSANTDMAPATTYSLVTRQSPASFTFQKLPEVCGPFGLNRSPSFQFMQRLKVFPPNIQDIVLVASTASIDIGVFTRAKSPLAKDVAPEKITNVFTTTMMAVDSRRAQLPMTADMTTDTSPIGMALDLSSGIKVSRPLPGEEIDESQGPLPALMVLNNDGILVAWWIVYADSVRQGSTYPGLVAVAVHQQSQAPQTSQPPFSSAPQAAAPVSGQSTFSTSSINPFGAAMANTSAAPAFGTSASLSSTSGAFGSPSGLGTQQSPWGAPNNSNQFAVPAFGKPSFGTSTSLGAATQGSAFGTSGGLGARHSPWGTSTAAAAAPTAPTSVFGQPGGIGLRSGSAFGGTSSGSAFGTSTFPTSGSGGGFAAFAKGSGFASSAAPSTGSNFGKQDGALTSLAEQKPGGTMFGKPSTPAAVSFDSTMDVGSSFGTTPKKSDDKPGGLFGSGNSFVLGSSWKSDNPPKDDIPQTTQTSTASFFGNNFGQALGETTMSSTEAQTEEAEMQSEASEQGGFPESPASEVPRDTTTPAETPAPSKFFSAPPLTGGLFGTQAQSNTTPVAVQSSAPAPPMFGQPMTSRTSPRPKSPTVKQEPLETPPGVRHALPEAPLPVDSTTKLSYTPGGSSASSTVASKSSHEDVDAPTPLNDAAPSPPPPTKAGPIAATPETPTDNMPPPPTPVPSKPRPLHSQDATHEELPLSGEDEETGLDDEGSGVDLGQETSPNSDPDHSLNITPESSFGGKSDKSPLGGLFQNISKQQPTKSLFGEIGKTSAPVFPPPKIQQSPRSPSPIRSLLHDHVLRPDTARSVSAPGPPSRGGITRKPLSNRPPHSNISSKAILPIHFPEHEEQDRLALTVRPEGEELSDREDERVRAELATEIACTMNLEPFLAHKDYVGDAVKPGIPGQIETVYRDINSMIDILGLNSRSLQAFIKGHDNYKEAGRSREDLEDTKPWCIVEVSDLTGVQQALESDLEQGRLQHADEKANECLALRKDLRNIEVKVEEIQHIVDTKDDPIQIEVLRQKPLSNDQSNLRKDLRRHLAAIQALLTEAEGSITLLRAKLAAQNTGKSKQGGVPKVPTVEAVERTIRRMTEMVQEKSGDIDVLENQMRRMNVLSSPTSSREGSPFVTPPTSIRKGKPLLRTPGTGTSLNGPGSFYTPVSSRSTFANPLASSITGFRPSPRKKLDQVDAVDARRYGKRATKRREINGLLKNVLVKDGIRVRSVDGLCKRSL